MVDWCRECGKDLTPDEKSPCNSCTAFNNALERLHNTRKIKDAADIILQLSTDEARCIAITHLKEFMCLNCGALDPSCRCDNDE